MSEWRIDPVTKRPYRVVQDKTGQCYVQWDSEDGAVLPIKGTHLESGRDGIYSSLRLSDTQPIRAFDPGAERPQSNVIVIPSGRKSALNSASAHTAEVLQEHFQKVIDARETSSGSQSDHDAIGNNAIGRIPYQRGLPTFYREHTSLDKPRSEVNPSVLESHPNAPGIQPGEFRGNAIRSTPGDMEKVDWRYQKVRNPRKFFKIGRVFSILWHEPLGANGTQLSQRGYFTLDESGEAIYSSIRRMVVVNEGPTYCWCLPIVTYGGRATAKSGLSPEMIRLHTIIYMSNTQPARLAEERHMIKQPLAVDPADPRQKLDPLSRLNFNKIYTVEHFVKVANIGTISRNSMPRFMSYWRNTVEES